MLKELVEGSKISCPCRMMQRRVPKVILLHSKGSSLEEELHTSAVSTAGGSHESGLATLGLVLPIEVGAVAGAVYKGLVDTGKVATTSGKVEAAANLKGDMGGETHAFLVEDAYYTVMRR